MFVTNEQDKCLYKYNDILSSFHNFIASCLFNLPNRGTCQLWCICYKLSYHFGVYFYIYYLILLNFRRLIFFLLMSRFLAKCLFNIELFSYLFNFLNALFTGSIVYLIEYHIRNGSELLFSISDENTLGLIPIPTDFHVFIKYFI